MNSQSVISSPPEFTWPENTGIGGKGKGLWWFDDFERECFDLFVVELATGAFKFEEEDEEVEVEEEEVDDELEDDLFVLNKIFLILELLTEWEDFWLWSLSLSDDLTKLAKCLLVFGLTLKLENPEVLNFKSRTLSLLVKTVILFLSDATSSTCR